MRILVSAFGTRGDAQPMIVLSLALQRAGHEVRFASSPDLAAWAAARGLAAHAVGESFSEALSRSRPSPAFPIPGYYKTLRFMERMIAPHFEGLHALGRDADLILGGGVQIASSSIAEALGRPFRFIAYGPQVFPSRQQPAPGMLHFHHPAWFNALTWFGYEAMWEIMHGVAFSRARKGLGLGPIHGIWKHVLGEKPLMASEPELAPMPTDLQKAVVQTGMLHDDPGEELAPELEAFLAEGAPPLYLGFGSMAVLEPDPRALGLQVARAVSLSGRRALLAGFPEDLPLPEGVMVVGATPHARLFPRLAGVLHHGGAGTTHAAARAGVPQLVVPYVLDQHHWAHRVHTLGLGPLPLPRGSLSVKALAAALLQLGLEKQSLQAARELGQKLRSRDGTRAALRELGIEPFHKL